MKPGRRRRMSRAAAHYRGPGPPSSIAARPSASCPVAALIAARIYWVALHGGSRELRVIAAALGVTIAAGAHDLGLLAQRLDHEGVYLLPYCSMLLFGSFLFAVQLTVKEDVKQI